ncbi:MAG: hypothetical protein R2751_20125 [Bacteroidales bacterium]
MVFSFENLYDIEDEEQRKPGHRRPTPPWGCRHQRPGPRPGAAGRTATQMIFPGAMVTYGGYEVAVNLLETTRLCPMR